MNEFKMAIQAEGQSTREESEQALPKAGGEIRTLSDLELVLAGGGDYVVSWP